MIREFFWPDGSGVRCNERGEPVTWVPAPRASRTHRPALTADAGRLVTQAIEREVRGGALLAQLAVLKARRVREVADQRDRRSRAMLAEIDAMVAAATKRPRWSFRVQGGVW